MSDAFGDYLRQIGRIPLLTPQEELHVGMIVRQWMDHENPTVDIERRGRRAFRRMVTANLRLVVTVTRRYSRRLQHHGIDPMDLVQAGNLGLLRAVEKYDPSRGYKFSTYGFWWIRQSIHRHLSEQLGSIRLPAGVVSLALRAAEIQSASRTHLSIEELAGVLDESPRRLLYAMNVHHRSNTVSLDQQIASADGPMTILETVSDENGTQLDDDYSWMQQSLQQLSYPEADVIKLRYGRGDQPSIGEVAKVIGRSKDQVQRLERKALAKLRRRLTPVLFPQI